MSKREWLIIAGVVVLGGVITGGLIYRNHKNDMAGMDHSEMAASTQSHATYSLNLMSGKSYLAAKPVMMHFAIQDQDGKVLKDFDTVHEKKLHLIVVRKDRTNFQHVHPTLDQNSGMFMIEPFTFPTDGDYRVFADFTPSNSQMGPDGMKLAATPYQDVQVGDMSKYTPQPIGDDKLQSSANGFDTSIFFPPSDDSPGVTSQNFTSGTSNAVVVTINKNGQAFKNLQSYLGALGHMVVLGPKLEFIHGHPSTGDTTNQFGLVTFNVTFPDPGQYKLFLQTQADNLVNTTDYTVTVKPGVSTAKPSSNQPMGGMDHNGH